MKLGELMLTAFGLGHLRPASGTWGSMPPAAMACALAILLGMNGLSGGDAWIINAALVTMLIVFSYACLAWGDWGEAWWGRKDPSQVVADEVAGQAVALLALPWRGLDEPSGFWWNVLLAATAFFTFRLFDIVKPPPAYQLQRWPSGWGILVDDLFAGVYALIATQLLAHLLWPSLLPAAG